MYDPSETRSREPWLYSRNPGLFRAFSLFISVFLHEDRYIFKGCCFREPVLSIMKSWLSSLFPSFVTSFLHFNNWVSGHLVHRGNHRYQNYTINAEQRGTDRDFTFIHPLLPFPAQMFDFDGCQALTSYVALWRVRLRCVAPRVRPSSALGEKDL